MTKSYRDPDSDYYVSLPGSGIFVWSVCGWLAIFAVIVLI